MQSNLNRLTLKERNYLWLDSPPAKLNNSVSSGLTRRATVTATATAISTASTTTTAVATTATTTTTTTAALTTFSAG